MHKSMHITYTGSVQGAMSVDHALDHDNFTQNTIKTACSHFSAKYVQGVGYLHIWTQCSFSKQ